VRLRYPLETTTFSPADRNVFRRRLGIGEEDFLILTVAENLKDPRKRIDLLLAAWDLTTKHSFSKNVVLALIGRNPPHELQGKHLLAIGPVAGEAEVAGHMAAADLLIHTAEMETFGQVLEEAQACGTPVLVSKAGGVSDAFEEGITGWSIENEGAEPLSRQILGLIKRRDELMEMREAVRKRTLLRHEPKIFFQEWNAMLSLIHAK
jgi:glycosyltransferase involved in cell wall biosynthesis